MESIEKEVKKLLITCDFVLKTKFESLLFVVSMIEPLWFVLIDN